ncbi:MAG: sterol desaturase family protein [Planctomycetota bacterium]
MILSLAMLLAQQTETGWLPAVRVVVASTLLASLWCIESYFTRASHRGDKLRHGLRNLTLAVFNACVLYLPIGLTTLAILSYTDRQSWGFVPWAADSRVIRFVIAFLLLDLWSYAWHLTNHRMRWLWRFHRVHHSDCAMDVTTAARFHVGEMAMAAVVRLPFLFLLGVSVADLVIYETALVTTSLLHHSAIHLGAVDPVLRLLIATPDMHRIHHSRREVESSSNYGSVLSVWDRLFASYRPEPIRPASCGLDQFDRQDRQSLAGMLKTPLDPMDPEEAGPAVAAGRSPSTQ